MPLACKMVESPVGRLKLVASDKGLAAVLWRADLEGGSRPDRVRLGEMAENPRHPVLRFKKIDDQRNTWSVRVGLGYWAVGVMDGSVIVWFWIGSHAEYDRM